MSHIIIGLFTTAFMTYFGYAVCPYLEGLELMSIVTLMGSGVGIATIVHFYFSKVLFIINSHNMKGFILSTLFWELAGIGMGLYCMYFHGFPPESGAKVFIGMCLVGLYSSAFFALEAQNKTIQMYRKNGVTPPHDASTHTSIVDKFLTLIFATLIVTGILLFLLFRNEFGHSEETSISSKDSFVTITRHILFVISVVGLAVISLSLKYSRNLKLIVDEELGGLKSIIQGDYKNRLPVLSSDEFGQFAKVTNEIVESMEFHQRNASEMYEKSIRDNLTGLYNRHYLEDQLAALPFIYDTISPISLVIFDIDHFKSINDEYGHATGDEVLKAIARHIQSYSPEEGFCVRYGGEEFYLVLPDMGRDKAYELAEDIRCSLEDKRLIPERDEPVTLSGGLASMRIDKFNINALADHADKALYKAKEQGRNQCVTV